jgi:diacylglycerol kinase (ATP)
VTPTPSLDGRSAQPVLAVVFNPTKIDSLALHETVAIEQEAAGFADTLWFETSVDDAGQDAARQAVEQGASIILAAGGDGTVRAVAEGMWESDAALALLPAGTGNLLARNLHLTLGDVTHSIHTAFAGMDRSIDLGMIDIDRQGVEATRHAFVVMAGLGLDAQMLANTDGELKKRIGWLAYVRAITAALRDQNQLTMRYSIDSAQTRSLKAHTLIVGNCGALPANIVLLPDAAIDDGLFDILLLRPQGAIGWVQIFIKVLWENGVLRRTGLQEKLNLNEVEALRYVTGSSVRIELETAHPIELDGDHFGEATGFTAWVEAGRLRVRVPIETGQADGESPIARFRGLSPSRTLVRSTVGRWAIAAGAVAVFGVVLLWHRRSR